MQSPVRIGTRRSPLALVQAHIVAAALQAQGACDTEIVPMTTSGDRIQDRALIEAGGKGLFTKEIEDALLTDAIDVAVHSMKDMPTTLPDGLVIGAMLPREDPRDAWLSPVAARFEDLPQGANVGTASLRRQAQVLAARPDLKVSVLRGNIGTRLEKLARGEVDGTLLALAGLKRLGFEDHATCVLEPDEMLPAVAQGAIGLEIRKGDGATAAIIAPLQDLATMRAVDAERAFLRVLDGSCRTPIAALASIDSEDMLTLNGKVLSPDGKTIYEIRRFGASQLAEDIGHDAGTALRAEAGEAFFKALATALEQ